MEDNDGNPKPQTIRTDLPKIDSVPVLSLIEGL